MYDPHEGGTPPSEPPGRWFDSTCGRAGAGEWDRTTDLRFTKPLLYQLSYAGRQFLRGNEREGRGTVRIILRTCTRVNLLIR